MLGIVKNNKIIPLTTDTGTGAPVGTLIQQYKKVPMSGYLYCDGSTFDQNAYPALYMYLGSNVLPDYRECVMVGAEQNTTDTIATHDVYTEGEFKDDQLQDHEHNVYIGNETKLPQIPSSTAGAGNQLRALNNTGSGEDIHIKDIVNARGGETTHGKQKAVYVYIKATSGLAENQQDNVLNNVKDYVDSSNSYSTDEIKTGGTWIDGKPIYRKVLTATLQTNEQILTIEVSNQLKSIVGIRGILTSQNVDFPIPYCFVDSSNVNQVYVYQVYVYCQGKSLTIIPRSTSGDYFKAGCIIRAIIEYTKTTD